MKKAVLIGFCVLIFALIFVFAFMEIADKKKSLLQYENPLKTLAESVSETEKPLPKMQNPRLVIKKSQRILEVFDGEKLVKTYKIALGFAPEGDKEIEGDGKTPEGEFYIFTKNANSKFYLSLGISYPSIADAARGLKQNLISKPEHDAIIEAINLRQTPPQKTRLGGEIYIHGSGSATDWTQGCVALSNREMEELFDAIPVGTNLKIEP
jgi:murein L,D-transpeptidase YafK